MPGKTPCAAAQGVFDCLRFGSVLRPEQVSVIIIVHHPLGEGDLIGDDGAATNITKGKITQNGDGTAKVEAQVQVCATKNMDVQKKINFSIARCCDGIYISSS